MKYVISESQNDKIMDLVKTVGERYTYPPHILKTDVVVRYDDEYGIYFVYPTFYVDRYVELSARWFEVLKHELSDYIESVVGVPILTGSYTFKEIEK